MKMQKADQNLIKNLYRDFLTEMKTPYSKRDGVEELETKLVERIKKLKRKEIKKFSKELQEYIKELGLFEKTVQERKEEFEGSRDYYRINKYGLQEGSKRAYICLLLEEGWKTREEILEGGKKKFGDFSKNSIDYVESYLRKNNFKLEVKEEDEKRYLKLTN